MRLLHFRIALLFVGAFVHPEVGVGIFGAQADGGVQLHEEVVAERLERGEVEGFGGLKVGDGKGDVC